MSNIYLANVSNSVITNLNSGRCIYLNLHSFPPKIITGEVSKPRKTFLGNVASRYTDTHE